MRLAARAELRGCSNGQSAYLRRVDVHLRIADVVSFVEEGFVSDVLIREVQTLLLPAVKQNEVEALDSGRRIQDTIYHHHEILSYEFVRLLASRQNGMSKMTKRMSWG